MPGTDIAELQTEIRIIHVPLPSEMENFGSIFQMAELPPLVCKARNM